MPLRTIPVRDITPADLQRLVNEENIEDKRIDYKQDLSQNKEDARALLEDISAMANTMGGDIYCPLHK